MFFTSKFIKIGKKKPNKLYTSKTAMLRYSRSKTPGKSRHLPLLGKLCDGSVLFKLAMPLTTQMLSTINNKTGIQPVVVNGCICKICLSPLVN